LPCNSRILLQEDVTLIQNRSGQVIEFNSRWRLFGKIWFSMKRQSGRDILTWILGIVVLSGAATSSATAADEKSDALLATMQQELARAQASLGKLDPAPYFLSYSVYDQTASMVIASQGALINS